MKLDEKLENIVIQYFKTEVPNLQCPVCKGDNFEVLNTILEIPEFFPGAVIGISQTKAPVIMVICEKCTHVLLFSAVKMGLVT